MLDLIYRKIIDFRFCGSRAILSGPAGGVIGYSETAYSKFNKQPIIGFDMGGNGLKIAYWYLWL